MPRGLSVLCQMALSVALVMTATLLARTALRAARAEPGFGLDGKVIVSVEPFAGGYSIVQARQACETLAERLKDVPEIQAVGLSRKSPVDLGWWPWSCERVVEYVPGRADDASGSLLTKELHQYEVNGDYFKAMGIRLLQGRPFDRLDSVPDAEEVVIIDELLARKLRPDGSALGCLIQYGFDWLPPPRRVVGIVPNLQSVGAMGKSNPTSMSQSKLRTCPHPSICKPEVRHREPRPASCEASAHGFKRSILVCRSSR